MLIYFLLYPVRYPIAKEYPFLEFINLHFFKWKLIEIDLSFLMQFWNNILK